jgi:hypothetical protein
MIANLLNRLGVGAVIGLGYDLSSRVYDHWIDLAVAKFPVLAFLGQ